MSGQAKKNEILSPQEERFPICEALEAEDWKIADLNCWLGGNDLLDRKPL